MNGRILSGPAAVLLVVLFFLPWVIVSCDGAEVGELSGYEIAIGAIPEDATGVPVAPDFNGEPLLFLVPIVGIVSLVLLGLAAWKGNFAASAGWGQIIVSLVGILALLIEWLQFQSGSEAGFEALVQPALWATVVALAVIGLGGLVDLVLGRRRGWDRRVKRPVSAGLQDPIFPYGESHTILDEDLNGPEAYAGATILDDALVGDTDSAKYTILDDDLASEPAGERTILDDDLAPGAMHDGQTILDDELESENAYGNVTILDDDLVRDESLGPVAPDYRAEVADPASDIVWEETEEPTVVSKQAAPPLEPPVASDPGQSSEYQDKTEVLQGDDVLAWLVITSGERKGEQFRLFSNTTIGRDLNNDIVLDDTALSGNHARVKVEGGRFFVFDRESTNGVFVFDEEQNRWEKRDAFELQQGSKIKLGRIVLQLVTP